MIGNYNTVLDLNAPNFKQLTNAGKSELESDLQIVDAYVAGSADFNDNYLDFQIGRFVTSWVEGKFTVTLFFAEDENALAVKN